ncbi:MAG: SDR family NAD(P)-dependent oxidoreductase [Pseudomonadota bacterium]
MKSSSDPTVVATATPIAVIGMAGFFARSANINDYWQLIYQGEDGITEVPATHWKAGDFFDPDPKRPDHVYCVRGGFIAPVAFDPTEFGIPPSNLEATDTSQLLGLLAAKSALQDAGYGEASDFDRDRTSVILGVTGTQELVIPLGARLGHPIWRRALSEAGVGEDLAEDVVSRISRAYVGWQENSFPGLLGNVVAGRIANRLHLGGTNCVVDAACASSMSAINLAMLELESGRSDMALTGGVDALNDIFMHMCFAKTMILSPTGDARPFSADADGTVLGEGVGIVVLKRLADAERDNDRIYAVIKGLGSSSDGKAQSIYAPLADGQAKALGRAYAGAGINPSTVRLVETHGTGTRVGDAVEFSALRGVYEASGANGNRCAIGSVKSMIGHTKAAAGAAGLIKTILALHHKVIPPTLKVAAADPRLNVATSPFHINTVSRPWFSEPEHPRRAGVSAFGFGGSNFHMVLEEYGARKREVVWAGAPQLAAFSGASRDAVAVDLESFADTASAPDADLRGLCQERRATFHHEDPYRLVLVIDSGASIAERLDAARKALSAGIAGGAYTGSNDTPSGRLAFLFPGQGSQYPDMGEDLVCRFPEAMAAVEDFCALGGDGMDLGAAVYPVRTPGAKDDSEPETLLRRTDVAQPAIGAVSLAILSVLARFGISPAAVSGHSFGEITALHAAGAIDRNTFIHLAWERGRCMAAAGNTPEGAGAMLAVKAPLETIAELVVASGADVVLANRNSPNQGVVSGTATGIDQFAAACREKGLRTVHLPVGAAFHSPLVAPAFTPFLEVLAELPFQSPAMPVYANVTGAPYPASVSDCRDTLGRQLISTVRFDDQIRQMHDDGCTTFVEVGPRRILSGLVSSILTGKPHKSLAVDASGGRRSALGDLARLIAELAADGHRVDLSQWDPELRSARRPKMTVQISGANVRANTAAPPARRPAPQPAAVAPTPPMASVAADLITAASKETATVMTRPMSPPAVPATHRSPAPETVSGALSAVQEGIQALQSLQLKTAETHQKFLETQAEAGRALQRMMAGIEQMIDPTRPEAIPASRPQVTAAHVPMPNAVPAAPTAAMPLSPPAAASTAPKPFQAPPEPLVAEALFAVVSALTGYPVETLSLGMDMESDLGIDSIKRVEILSAMEERLPRLPSVVPEEMVHLRTLGDIVRHLDGAAIAPPPLAATAAPAASNADAIATALIAVVSTLTGYPADMLNLGMHMESDLGIDSIKRVEILSEMETRLPDLPGVHPEEMAALGTLEEIVAYLAGNGPRTGSQAPAADTGHPTATTGAAVEIAPSDSVARHLVDIISALTGYPAETLSLDMDLESDLGIDSIKRVEILSAVEERLPDLPAVSPEAMTGLRTIAEIVAHLSGNSGTAAQPAAPCPACTASSNDTPAPFPPLPGALLRQLLQAVVTPFTPGPSTALPRGAAVWIVHESRPFAEALAASFGNHGVDTVLMSMAGFGHGNTPAADAPAAAGLILLSDDGAAHIDVDVAVDSLTSAFRAIQAAAPHLTAPSGDYRFVASVTRLDGRFGLGHRPVMAPISGALAGLVKTARLEWPHVRCTAFDVCPDMAADDAAARLVQELLQPDSAMPPEIGMDLDTRWTLTTAPAPISAANQSTPEEGEVVLVTGGARGITAETCVAMAHAWRPTLILIGRSPQPGPEPEWLQGVSDPAEIKKAILHQTFSGKASPREIEAAFRGHMANREVAATLAAIEDAGARVLYRPADVRDRNALAAIVAETRAAFGPIRAVVHGAGILEDRHIIDKTADQVKRVLETKIAGFHHLEALTTKDPLRAVVVFSSVAARYGNIGQADYAMANEALNKMVRAAARRHADCRAVAINWGPWEGGMVTPALQRAFTQRGIGLIPMADGAACMVAEMAAGSDSGGEVIYGCAIMPAEHTAAPAAAAPTRALTAVASQLVDVTSHPVLASHILGGKPVVPFALITEWLGHSALHHNPGLVLSALEDIRLFHGIKIDHGAKKIRLMAGKIRRYEADYYVDVEIRNGRSERGTDLIHASARAVLSERLPVAPVLSQDPAAAIAPCTPDVADLYRSMLFHGDALQGIQQVSGLAESGMVAHLKSAPKPAEWITAPIRSQWIGDPLVMDAAFQMAIIWCRQYRGCPCLPSYIGEYQQFCRRFPANGVTAVMTVEAVTRHKFKAVFTFREQHGEATLARIDGFEATMDAGLVSAFKASDAA